MPGWGERKLKKVFLSSIHPSKPLGHWLQVHVAATVQRLRVQAIIHSVGGLMVRGLIAVKARVQVARVLDKAAGRKLAVPKPARGAGHRNVVRAENHETILTLVGGLVERV